MRGAAMLLAFGLSSCSLPDEVRWGGGINEQDGIGAAWHPDRLDNVTHSGWRADLTFVHNFGTERRHIERLAHELEMHKETLTAAREISAQQQATWARIHLEAVRDAALIVAEHRKPATAPGRDGPPSPRDSDDYPPPVEVEHSGHVSVDAATINPWAAFVMITAVVAIAVLLAMGKFPIPQRWRTKSRSGPP